MAGRAQPASAHRAHILATPLDGLRDLAFLVRRLGGDRSWVIDFYRSLGATAEEAWTTYRLTGEALAALAEG